MSTHITGSPRSSARLDPPAGRSEAPAGPPAAGGILAAWTRFWLAPVEPIGLHVVRVCAGLLFLSWLGSFAGHEGAYFGLQGWFDAQAFRDASRSSEGLPVPVSWSVLYQVGSSPTAITAIYWASLLVLLLFTLGVAVRLTAVLTWVIVASFICNPVIDYAADYLLLILAFYLMVGYLLYGQWSGRPSWLTRIVGPADVFVLSGWLPGRRLGLPGDGPERSHAANLALRLLQVHFAIVVLVSGLHKLQFGDWWAGLALFFPLHPPLETTAQELQALAGRAENYLFWLSLAGYLLVAWQLTFPAFAWRPRCRWLLVGGTLVGWIGSVAVYRLPIYGPAFFVASLAYLTAPEWHRVGRVLGWARGVVTARAGRSEHAAPARVAVKS